MNAMWYYFQRDFIKWTRWKVNIFASLVTPAAWLIFVGLTLPVKFTDNYLEYLTPGIMVMTVLFASFQSGNLVIFDKVLGFLNKFFALPPQRERVTTSRINSPGCKSPTFSGFPPSSSKIIISFSSFRMSRGILYDGNGPIVQ